jgi:hypothetical protein
MKRNLLFIILLLTFAPLAFAQSVVITPKKVVYKRPKPSEDYKKSFTITYPKVSGVSKSVAKKIEDNLSFEKAFDFSLKDEINTEDSLDSASFKVLYNNFGILNVLLMEEVSGAYPSSFDKSIVIDVKTGEPLKAADFFTRQRELAEKVRNVQQGQIKRDTARIKKDEPEIEDPLELFGKTDYTAENLDDFSVSDKGITFRYDYEFPHVALALQPEGRFFFTWAQLKPYIKRDGLLARFVR